MIVNYLVSILYILLSKIMPKIEGGCYFIATLFTSFIKKGECLFPKEISSRKKTTNI